jgi:hypothetical protein
VEVLHDDGRTTRASLPRHRHAAHRTGPRPVGGGRA